MKTNKILNDHLLVNAIIYEMQRQGQSVKNLDGHSTESLLKKFGYVKANTVKTYADNEMVQPMDKERLIYLLKLGYFPVTDDFWAAADMLYVIGRDFNWALRMPLSKQKFMPYHQDELESLSYEELKNYAYENLMSTYR